MHHLAACALIAALSVLVGHQTLESASDELALLLHVLGSGSIAACA